MSEPPVTPPETEFGFAYEYALDINLGTELVPNWQQIRFNSGIDPQVTTLTEDGATYDDKGSPHPVRTGESWIINTTIQQHRLSTGDYLPEVEALKALTEPDARGSAAVGHFRWYDNPASGEPNEDDAYEGRGTVQINRGQTGNTGIGAWSVTITGQGPRTQITNPLSD